MQRSFIHVLCAVVVATLSTLAAQTADPWVGTWRLSVSKSTYSPGPAPRSGRLTVEALPDGRQKHTLDGINAQGQTTHSERTVTFDGAEVRTEAVTPPTTAITIATFRRIDARSFELMQKVDGKPTTTHRIAVSSDGKTLTQTVTGANARGQAVNDVIVYDRQ